MKRCPISHSKRSFSLGCGPVCTCTFYSLCFFCSVAADIAGESELPQVEPPYLAVHVTSSFNFRVPVHERKRRTSGMTMSYGLKGPELHFQTFLAGS